MNLDEIFVRDLIDCLILSREYRYLILDVRIHWLERKLVRMDLIEPLKMATLWCEGMVLIGSGFHNCGILRGKQGETLGKEVSDQSMEVYEKV